MTKRNIAPGIVFGMLALVFVGVFQGAAPRPGERGTVTFGNQTFSLTFNGEKSRWEPNEPIMVDNDASGTIRWRHGELSERVIFRDGAFLNDEPAVSP